MLAPTPDAAAAMVVPFIIPLFVFAGLFLNIRQVDDSVRKQR
jgi:hypothetical protein